MDNPEILIHISAPSGASDDARYRAQVEAILGFQSASRQAISIGAADAAAPRAASPANTTSPNSTRPAGEHENGLNPSVGLRESSPGSGGSKGKPNAQGQTIAAGNTHVTPRVQRNPPDTPQIPKTVSPVPRVPASNQTISSRKGTSQKRYTRLENDSLETPVSVIPDSQPAIGQLEPEQDLEYLGPQLQPPSRGNSLDNGLSAKRPRGNSPAPETRPTSRSVTRVPRTYPFNSESSLSGPQHHNTSNAPTHSPNQQCQEQPSIQLSALPLTIRPPPPPVSRNPFSTHITPTLELLVNRLNPARVYKPTSQTRALDKLERGYWLLHINVPDTTHAALPNNHNRCHTRNANAKPHPNTWNTPLLTRLWTFLSSFIAKEARAGWGVWCILEDAAQAAEAHPTIVSQAESESATSTSTYGCKSKLLTLKVYTWGETACHIYLLLFLGSERRVRGMGAQWKDAREEVVVQMP